MRLEKIWLCLWLLRLPVRFFLLARIKIATVLALQHFTRASNWRCAERRKQCPSTSGSALHKRTCLLHSVQMRRKLDRRRECRPLSRTPRRGVDFPQKNSRIRTSTWKSASIHTCKGFWILLSLAIRRTT